MLRVVAVFVEVHPLLQADWSAARFSIRGGEKTGKTEQWSDDHAEQVHRLGGNAE
mgnify:CR=1 FL=1